MHARAPGSTSNLGPGFDVLGLALKVYVEVDVELSSSFELTSEGEGEDLPQDGSHLAAQIASEILGHDRVAIHVHSEIPVGRGLGSSAALAVATAAATGAGDPFLVAARADGHAENAAASRYGGLVAATLINSEPVARRLGLDSSLCFVVLVPERELSTREARAALSAQVPFPDAVFNLGRLALLIAGLAHGDELLREAGEDRLHQDARAAIYPEAPELLARLREAGATVSTWSGAGTSLLGICRSAEIAKAVRDAGEHALSALDLAGVSRVLEPDLGGLVVTDAKGS